MGDIPPQLLAGGVWFAALVVLWWMLATDRLVTGAAHRREIANRDARIDEIKADRDRLEEKQEQTIALQRDQIEKLSVVGEAFVRIMTAVESIGKAHQ